jgi:hypothetical protein
LNLKYKDNLQNPYYAAGNVYAASTQDTLLCQVYFNPFVINVLEQMIYGHVYSAPVSTVNNSNFDQLFIEIILGEDVF